MWKAEAQRLVDDLRTIRAGFRMPGRLALEMSEIAAARGEGLLRARHKGGTFPSLPPAVRRFRPGIRTVGNGWQPWKRAVIPGKNSSASRDSQGNPPLDGAVTWAG
jgi:hypothetical protein